MALLPQGNRQKSMPILSHLQAILYQPEPYAAMNVRQMVMKQAF